VHIFFFSKYIYKHIMWLLTWSKQITASYPVLHRQKFILEQQKLASSVRKNTSDTW